MNKTTVKCYECGCTTDTPVPHPQDPKEEVKICQDCEYAITENLSPHDVVERYADRRGK